MPAPDSPPRLGVISNPHSGHNRRGLEAVSALLAGAHGVHHVVTRDPEQLAATLAQFARDGVDTLAVNGGDGSLARVVGLLVERSPFTSMPLVCALPGGTSNVTAADTGMRGGLPDALARLLAWRRGEAGEVRRIVRPVIGVRGADGRALGHGFIFDAGAVVDGIEYWNRRVKAHGPRGDAGPGLALARTLWGMLRGHEGFAEPLRARITEASGAPLDGEFRLIVASALERLFLGIHPFCDEGTGRLLFTAVERRAPHFLRSLPPLLAGRRTHRMTPANGYHSHRIDALGLDFDGVFTLDGELYRSTDAPRPLHLAVAGEVRLLGLPR